METIELEVGDKELQVDVWDDGTTEITVSQEHHGWNDGGKAIAGDIILNGHQANELFLFLSRNLNFDLAVGEIETDAEVIEIEYKPADSKG